MKENDVVTGRPTLEAAIKNNLMITQTVSEILAGRALDNANVDSTQISLGRANSLNNEIVDRAAELIAEQRIAAPDPTKLGPLPDDERLANLVALKIDNKLELTNAPASTRVVHTVAYLRANRKHELKK